jgi:hypothetical protein
VCSETSSTFGGTLPIEFLYRVIVSASGGETKWTARLILSLGLSFHRPYNYPELHCLERTAVGGESQSVEDAPTILITGKNGTEEIEGALRYSALKPHLDSALGE